MEMLYVNIMMTLFILEAVLGCLLFCIHLAADDKNIIYRRSRYFLATTFLLLSANGFIHGLFNLRSTSPLLAIGFNISTYYAMAILCGLTYIPLISIGGFGRHRLARLLQRWGVIVVSFICANLFFEKDSPELWGVTIIGTLVFFIDASSIALRFFKMYHVMVHHIEENYVNAIEVFIKCLYKSAMSIAVLGISSVALTYMPKYVIIVYSLLAIIIFIYMFVSFINYALHMNLISGVADDMVLTARKTAEAERESRQIVIEEADDEDSTASEASPSMGNIPNFDKKIEQWIENRGYCNSDISISNMAAEFGTNRQYLYEYIKNKQQTNFRLFVNTLRVKYAQTLLAQGNMSISEIADAVGFKTQGHFSDVFKKISGTSPSQWVKDV
ncbi:MAG: helix-turn-helix transcriptional regulator [Bacteroidaceae bacterium]|nr:helix-turn-helix transcriptional regulator [Bacteroidaceae bacterium]